MGWKGLLERSVAQPPTQSTANFNARTGCSGPYPLQFLKSTMSLKPPGSLFQCPATLAVKPTQGIILQTFSSFLLLGFAGTFLEQLLFQVYIQGHMHTWVSSLRRSCISNKAFVASFLYWWVW